MPKQNAHPYLSNEDLEDIRKQMFAFAMNQLSNPTLAEDAVQDAIIKTITHHDSFKGKSAYKSWVFSILKNTIIDILRKEKRNINVSSMGNADNQTNDDILENLFDQDGHWHKVQKPSKWETPEEDYQNSEFWVILENCLTNLPAEQSRVFMMREYIGLETNEICDECNITSNKFYVIMHRARLRLQSCLNINWFENSNSSEENTGGTYA